MHWQWWNALPMCSELWLCTCPIDVFRVVTLHMFLFLFLCSFLNGCGCSTAKPMTPPRETFFHLINASEHGSYPSLTTRDRELVSVLEVRIEPEDLNRRPLTPQCPTDVFRVVTLHMSYWCVQSCDSAHVLLMCSELWLHMSYWCVLSLNVRFYQFNI